ncbi:MAG: 30S ribosomal protein S17 [Chloroflexi bacterium RBG_13_51_36]|nr:MAG: 30S ribosomal protein S17 [Chloroflexi bacterium RBG_13_51_36]
MSHLEKRKVKEGLVVSDKMNKTVVVAVETRKVHPLYKKAIKGAARYKAHDENNACKIGDKVKIIETRPLSKGKKWRVIEIVSKKGTVETRPNREK